MRLPFTTSLYHSCSALIYNFCWLLVHPSWDAGTPWIMLGHHDNPACWGYKDRPKVENAVCQPKSQQIGHTGLTPALSQLQLFAACKVWPSQLWQPYSKRKHWNKMAPQPLLLWPTHLTSHRGKNEQALDKPHRQYSTFKDVRVPQLTQPLSLPRFSSHWFTGLPGMRLLGM